MRVLITGASGFVGRHLLPILQSGLNQEYSNLTCWSRVVHGDVLSYDDRVRTLNQTEPDVVIHLAWIKTGTLTYEGDPSNPRWAHATVEFAREVVSRGSRFLGLGSMIEDDPLMDSPYAIAKRQAGEEVLAAGRPDALTVWMRPSWIFDFVEPRPRVVQEAAESALAGVPFKPRNPQTRRDFIHVDDVARAIRRTLNSDSTGRVDIRSGHLTSVAALLSAYGSWRSGSSRVLPPHSNDQRLTAPLLGTPEELDQLDWEPRETTRILGRFWTDPDM